MPATESSSHPDDRDRDRDPERSDRGDRGGSRQKTTAAAASKSSKDLSHVPCKFFKVGGCTAGSSCPFSHNLVEPGGQKETCAWFVKGNCKFGHKCALAHILPGQSMAMDRKNKKAAQVAAAAAAAGERGERSDRGGKDGRGGRGGNQKRDGHVPSSGSSGNRNPLLSGGSTAPTRIASSTPTGRPPMSMPLKATLSPSAPAPPLASFGVLEDLEGDGVQLATAPAQGKQASQDSTTATATTAVGTNTTPSTKLESQTTKPNSPEPLPSSAPRAAATPTKPSQDFGPIGSPPSSVSRSNGTTFSPGTSPHQLNGINVAPGASDHGNNFLSSSPFSAPGTQSVFLSGGGSYNGAGGMAASLGSGLAMMGGRKGWGSSAGGESGSIGTGGFAGMVPSSVQQRMNGGGGRAEFDVGFEYEEYGAKRSALGMGRPVAKRGPDVAVEDEDLEDFLPSSLTDLLTPEERSRRMSRSNSGQGPATALGASGAGFAGGDLGGSGAGGGPGMGMGHRYSRSVPAPSLLGDIKSIWAENNANPLPSSPPTHRGTPSSSFMTRFDPGASLGHNGGGEDMLSMSMGSASSGMMGLSPSNASAAFLPGLHSHYLTSKAKQAQAQQLGLGGVGRGVRGTSGPMYGGTGGTSTNLANNYLLGAGSALPGSPGNHIHTHTNSQTNTHHTYRATPSPFDLTQHQHHHLHPQPHTARPIPSNATSNNPNPDEGPHLLSPGARALQSHAPGQSLPQGLAAGYSRIHALPPPPSLASPGSASIFGGGTPPTTDPAANSGISSSGPYGGWKATAAAAASSPPTGGASGLDAMFSRLSYSAATVARTGTGMGGALGAAVAAAPGTGPQMSTSTMSPPGLTRNISGGRYPQGQLGPLSPLNGPAVSRDDDDELFSMDG